MKIYHYTDIHALKSILETGVIWLSDIRYLNDKNEYKEGESWIKAYFEKRCHLPPEEGGMQAHNSQKVLQHFTDYLKNSKSSYTLVGSFSHRKDLLSQWRGYCPTDGGYCIEFDTGDTDELGYKLHNCVYDSDKKDSLTRTLFKKSREAILKGRSKEKLKSFQITWSNIAKFKNEGFKEEEEARLIVFKKKNDKDIEFRPKGNLLIPFIKHEIGLRNITSICIGPCQNIELAEESLKSFIDHLIAKEEHSFSEEEFPIIERTKTTFRS